MDTQDVVVMVSTVKPVISPTYILSDTLAISAIGETAFRLIFR